MVEDWVGLGIARRREVAAGEAQASGRLAAGERVLVVFDVLDGNLWRAGARGAEESDDPFSDALNWLQGAPGAG